MPITNKINFNSPTTWVGLVIAVGLLIYLINRVTKAKSAPPPKPVNLPWGFGLSVADSDLIREYSIKLHDDMDGLNFNGHDSPLYAAYLIEPPEVFAGVYNDYNAMYFAENEGTLNEWLQSEYFYLASEQANVDAIIARMAANNLS